MPSALMPMPNDQISTLELLQLAVTIVISLSASAGFWTYITRRYNNRDMLMKMVLGLAHDRIIWLGMHYIERGWITQDEYESLKDHLYKPYLELGGNGTAQKVMNDVERLPIKRSKKLDPITGETLP